MIPDIDPSAVGSTGLVWLLISYGYILYYASNLISEGSDLLLLVPSLAGLVGGVVLPLLGAVPDGAIMLFSGLGDVEEAQETLAVGVGALAGSTIMLLTIPWAMSIYYGRVDFSGKDMQPNYKGNPKLTEGIVNSLSGVTLTPEIHHGACMMMMTTIPYFLIQVPAFFLSGDREEVSSGEKNWALAGFVSCMVFFVYYLYTQLKMSNEGADKIKRMAVIKDSLNKGAISLSGALAEKVEFMEKKHSDTMQQMVNEETKLNVGSHQQNLGDRPSPEVAEYLKGILSESFHLYDRDNSGCLGKKEFSLFLKDFHESISDDQLEDIFRQFDLDGNGAIDMPEFICACYVIIRQANRADAGMDTSPRNYTASQEVGKNILHDDECDESEEEEEIPEDLTSLSPNEQQRAIKRRAFGMLFLGTALVLMFSDPMVDVLAEVAVRLNIPAFYVSFVLAPLASNASEVIASQYYAAKKTRKTITVALTALEGAASMNNTFCLSIFMALIYFRGLAWQYSAETIAIISVQLAMGLLAMKDKMSTSTGFLVLAIFPLSVVIVAILEYMGLN
mmetsp:Transcript_24810/g.50851  ORF Transcript_24810/g.50851 Transcript_24810/m.50851 type:complete len:561 (+) Transcript_24810:129-1811(+)